MAGAASTTNISGSRSEALAEYLFGAWGVVLRGRTDSDYGLDLFCSLGEQVGKQSWVRANYTVQARSNTNGWDFGTPDEVKWLIEHPSPLYLTVVEKELGKIRVYQTFARFHVWALGDLPEAV